MGFYLLYYAGHWSKFKNTRTISIFTASKKVKKLHRMILACCEWCVLFDEVVRFACFLCGHGPCCRVERPAHCITATTKSSISRGLQVTIPEESNEPQWKKILFRSRSRKHVSDEKLSTFIWCLYLAGVFLDRCTVSHISNVWVGLPLIVVIEFRWTATERSGITSLFVEFVVKD